MQSRPIVLDPEPMDCPITATCRLCNKAVHLQTFGQNQSECSIERDGEPSNSNIQNDSQMIQTESAKASSSKGSVIQHLSSIFPDKPQSEIMNALLKADDTEGAIDILLQKIPSGSIIDTSVVHESIESPFSSFRTNIASEPTTVTINREKVWLFIRRLWLMWKYRKSL